MSSSSSEELSTSLRAPGGGRRPRHDLRRRTLLAAAAVLLVLATGLGAWGWMRPRPAAIPQLAYTTLLRDIDARRVESLVVRPGVDIRGEWAGPRGIAGPDFAVAYPVSEVDGLAARAEKAGVALTLEPAPDSAPWYDAVQYGMTLLLLGGVLFYLFRQSRGGEMGELGGGGKSDTTFADVAGGDGRAPHQVALQKGPGKRGGVIFIDEIDALGGKRGRNRSHNEDDRTLNQLLVEMDGFDPLSGVVVIAATIRPDDLDEALKRPGRFDRLVTVTTPTRAGPRADPAAPRGSRASPEGPRRSWSSAPKRSPAARRTTWCRSTGSRAAWCTSWGWGARRAC